MQSKPKSSVPMGSSGRKAPNHRTKIVFRGAGKQVDNKGIWRILRISESYNPRLGLLDVILLVQWSQYIFREVEHSVSLVLHSE